MPRSYASRRRRDSLWWLLGAAGPLARSRVARLPHEDQERPRGVDRVRARLDGHVLPEQVLVLREPERDLPGDTQLATRWDDPWSDRRGDGYRKRADCERLERDLRCVIAEQQDREALR